MTSIRIFRVALLMAALGVAASAAAQTPTLSSDLRDQLSVEFLQSAFGGPDTVETFRRLLLVQVGAFPISSSSGGFSYSFDPALGVSVRNSAMFGPTFAERPLTLGRHRFDFGLTHQYVTFDTLDGKDLDGQNIAVYQAFTGGNLYFGTTLSLRLDASIDVIFGSVGITDKFDVGVSVPLVKVRQTVTTVFTDNRPINLLGVVTTDIRDRVASGVGDVGIRAKYHFLSNQALDLGLILDARLPTGEAENFLGAGKASYKAMLAASRKMAWMQPYGNVAYANGGASNETDFVGGVEVLVTKRASLSADVGGRRLLNVSPLTQVSEPFVPNPAFTIVRAGAGDKGLTLVQSTIGVKVNVVRELLLSANVILPLTKTGLRDRVTPVVGFSYAF